MNSHQQIHTPIWKTSQLSIRELQQKQIFTCSYDAGLVQLVLLIPWDRESRCHSQSNHSWINRILCLCVIYGIYGLITLSPLNMKLKYEKKSHPMVFLQGKKYFGLVIQMKYWEKPSNTSSESSCLDKKCTH